MLSQGREKHAIWTASADSDARARMGEACDLDGVVGRRCALKEGRNMRSGRRRWIVMHGQEWEKHAIWTASADSDALSRKGEACDLDGVG